MTNLPDTSTSYPIQDTAASNLMPTTSIGSSMQDTTANHSTPTAPTSNSSSLPGRRYSLADILGGAIPREEALGLIRSDPEANRIFNTFPTEEQAKLLAFIQGSQGLLIMHDRFAQKILSPHEHPQRLEGFLSAVLGESATILEVLPREGSQLSEKGSLVIMDFLVRLTGGSIANVEIQQVGYAFPGERAGCYHADLIMRQYNLLRSQKGKAFSYHDMKPVYLIVLMGQSPASFLKATPQFIHREIHYYDSGAQAVNLTKTIYISLDTFQKFSHNKNIDTKLSAWLTFLGSDRPADIVKLVNTYPEFLPLYRDVVEFRRHPKELMTMFSEALAIMDHNTELYMIDEMKKELDEKNVALIEKDNALSESKSALASAIAAFRGMGKTDEEICQLMNVKELPL